MMRLTNADGTSCVITKEELASAFNRWMERYLQNPEEFEREFQVVGRFVDERTKGKPTYGDLSAEYLLSLTSPTVPPPPLAAERFRCEKPDATQLDRIEFKLHQLREEVRTMGQTQQDQATQLSSDVTALTSAFTGFEAAVAAEIAAIKSSPAAADPVVAQALTNIEALTAKIVADTAAAQPPAPATTTDPGTPAADTASTDIPTIT